MRFGCLFSTRKAVKSLSESRTQTWHAAANQTDGSPTSKLNWAAVSHPCKLWDLIPAALTRHDPPCRVKTSATLRLQEVTLLTLPQEDKKLRDNSQHIGSLIPNSTSACFPLNPESLLYFLFCYGRHWLSTCLFWHIHSAVQLGRCLHTSVFLPRIMCSCLGEFKSPVLLFQKMYIRHWISLRFHRTVENSALFCWSMLWSCFTNDTATEKFSALVSPFKILLSPKILSTFK